MFTIKHVDLDGNEFAIEAESYEIQWDHQAEMVRLMSYDQKYRDANYTGLWAGRPARGNELSHDTVFVMNRYGSTITSLHFIPNRQGEERAVREAA